MGAGPELDVPGQVQDQSPAAPTEAWTAKFHEHSITNAADIAALKAAWDTSVLGDSPYA